VLWVHTAPDGFSVVAAAERRAVLADVTAAVLTGENRQVILLRYKRDLTFRQIAMVLDSTEDAVAQMHGRALEKLRSALAALRITSRKHI
jgi:DNA-directed RNA polymerase specialized sigma subunit